MNYLDLWSNNILTRHSFSIEKELHFIEEYEKHLGPRIEYAKVEVKIKPSDGFNVIVEDSVGQVDDYTQELIDYAVFGILDILMCSKEYSLRNIAISVIDLGVHPVDSNTLAFRKTGRIIGNKILQHARF